MYFQIFENITNKMDINALASLYTRICRSNIQKLATKNLETSDERERESESEREFGGEFIYSFDCSVNEYTQDTLL